MPGKIIAIDIGDYERDPNVYQKHDYNPFRWGSTTWKVFYFKLITKRKRVRVFSSYGRTMSEARRGLEVATRLRTGFVQISRSRYKKLGGE